MRYDIQKRTFLERKFSQLKSVTAVQRAFRSRYKTRNAPTANTIKDIAKKFESTGSVHDMARKGKGETEFRKTVRKQVQALIESDCQLSLNDVRPNTDASRSTVYRVLKKDLGLKPYRFKERQKLQEADKPKRLAFAQWFLDLPADSEMLILFSDEAYFHLTPSNNPQNNRMWLPAQPNTTIERPLQDEQVLVWCGISGTRIYGPYFFESYVNQHNYLAMLQNFLWPKVLRTEGYKNLYFQQDGAPAHKANIVQEWLKDKFKNRFISKSQWPPRSPDLNPCDFFLWGYLKDLVYNPIPRNLDELKANIETAIKNIKKETLEKVAKDFEKRCISLISAKGGHIETD